MILQLCLECLEFLLYSYLTHGVKQFQDSGLKSKNLISRHNADIPFKYVFYSIDFMILLHGTLRKAF